MAAPTTVPAYVPHGPPVTLVLTRPAAPVQPPAPTEAPSGGAGKLRRGSAERCAVVVVTAAIALQPMLHPTGPKNTSPVDILLVAAIFFAAVWAAGTHRKLRAPYFVPVALYLVAGAASGLFSTLPGLSLSTLMTDILLFAWCLAVVNVLSSPRAMRLALAAWSWSGIFWAGILIVAWLGHISFLEGLNPADGNRVLFTFGDPNYAATYWDTAIFVVFASHTPAKRWMRFTGYGMLLWALALTESNGGILALGVGVAFLLLVRSYRRRGWVGFTASLVGGVLVLGTFFTLFPLSHIRQWAAHSNQSFLVNSIGRSAQSSSERNLLVKETLGLYQQSSGVLGLGPASTKSLLTTQLFPYANEAHDDYLAALVERGALGLFALILLVTSAVCRASPLIRRPLSPQFAAAVPLPVGLVAGLLALSVNSFYEEIQHFRFMWALLGIIAVLGRDARR